MVFAVQCPEPKCRKFMLVEEHDRGKVVPCLICKTPIRVGTGDPRDTRYDSRPDDSRPAAGSD
jgi:hypothetical protein